MMVSSLKNTLFVGNGLNRTLTKGGGISWDGLLAEERARFGLGGHCQPPTMEYERIMNESLKASDKPSDVVYLQSKRRLLKRLAALELDENAIHKTFTSLPFDSFITTNYDYLLEKSLSPGLRVSELRRGSKEWKYSLYRRHRVTGRDVYHIHGEQNAPASVCLGYEHYAGTLTFLRQTLLKHMDGYKDTVLMNILRGEYAPTGCFAELFFTNNLYFVGWSLDRTEIDIWWLLVYRAYLQNSNYRGIAHYLTNELVFYDTNNDENPELKSMLHSLNVTYVWRHQPKLAFYDRFEGVAADIAHRMKTDLCMARV